MNLFLLFGLIICLFSCNLNTSNSDSSEMRSDVEKAVTVFCKAQNKQIEAAQKTNKMQDTEKKTSMEELGRELEEANLLMEEYGEQMKQIAEKYKGQERTYGKMIKESLKRCK